MSQNESELIVYTDGWKYWGCPLPNNSTEKKNVKKFAKEHGQIGYLSGFRYFDNHTDCVLVFFSEKPNNDEIELRRKNGLLRAKWYYL